MRQLVRLSMLLTSLAACVPGPQTDEERTAAAARADSSAAGYDVGPSSGTQASSVPTREIGQPGVDTSRAPGRRTDSSGVARPPRPTEVVIPEPVVTVPRTASQPGRRPPVTPIDTSGDGPLPLPPLESALESRFLVYDTLKRTASFQLAAEDELTGPLNFNGVRRGGRTLTVPLGWRLSIEFANRDDKLPHSLVIVESSFPVPDPLPEPAFPRAQTIKVEQGLLEGETDELIFVADRDGQYLMACGVVGHAQGGQWLTLMVSASATVPTYR